MKKLFLVGALALTTLFASAQDGLQGKWFVGGQFGYEHSKIKDGGKSDNYTILPTIGTFISPDLAVGAALGYAGTKEGDFKTNQVVIAPLARKYWNISGGLFFFGQASLPVSFGDKNFGELVDKDGKTYVGQFDKKAKTLGINVELAPGFDYIINERFSVETSFTVLSLGYNNEKQGDYKKDTFGFFANRDNGPKFGDLKIGFKMIF